MTACSSAFHGNVRHIDWRALIVAVLMYAGMFVWLLSYSPVAEPLRASADMVLVTLLQAPSPMADPLARDTPTPSTQTAAPNHVSKIRRSRSTAQLSPHREHIVVPEGQEALTSGVPMANPTPGSMPTHGVGTGDSITSRGNGTMAGARFRSPRVLNRWLPRYPFNAFQSGQEGVVDVLVTIDANGKAIASKAYKSSGSASLDEAAVAAVMRWEFRPAERAGRPITAQAIISIDWLINPATIVAKEIVPAELSPVDKAQKKRECFYGRSNTDGTCRFLVPGSWFLVRVRPTQGMPSRPLRSRHDQTRKRDQHGSVCSLNSCFGLYSRTYALSGVIGVAINSRLIRRKRDFWFRVTLNGTGADTSIRTGAWPSAAGASTVAIGFVAGCALPASRGRARRRCRSARP